MKSTAFDFATAVEHRIEAISTREYHERARPVKRLIEELYPLSRFAVALKHPGLIVEVEANEDSGRTDGTIWLTGYLERTFEVQVTFAGYGRSDSLRSALLAEQGFAPGAGPIEKDRITGKIVATMAAEDIDAQTNRIGRSIVERVQAKCAKTYAPGTVLLVAFEDVGIRGRGWWSCLYAAIDCAGGIERGAFSQVYLFNSCSNELQQAA